LLAFYRVVFSKTSVIAEWSEPQYLFFVGCYFAMNGLLETLFLENCNEFAELVRKGDLDFLLLRPIDEQFLITCRRVDWSTAPNVLMGVAVMVLSLVNLDWAFDPTRVAVFLLVFGCGVLLAYSFMVLLTATGVWLVRNQSMMELWWLFSSLTRYPREIYLRVSWAEPIGLFFTFIVPFLLVVNVPAESMVKMLDWRLVGFTLLATAVGLWVSRWFFRRALRSYRSASS
jgi:ABC-2 type transport system permease protein